MIDPQPPTSTLLPVSQQSRCGGGGYGGCGYQKHQCRGPIRLLVGLVIRKVQEKKGEKRLAANWSDERDDEVQELGIVETVDEKQKEEREVKEEKKDEDVEVLTKSVRSMSL